MKVYVVVCSFPYEGLEIEGVFDTYEKAEAFMQPLQQEASEYSWTYKIQDWEVK